MRKRTIAAIAGGVLVVGGIASMGGEDEQTPETAQPTATAEATPTVEETEEPTTEEPTEEPEPVVEEPTEPEPVEEVVEEAAEEFEMDRETELLILQVAMDETIRTTSAADMADMCMGWQIAPDMMIDAFMSEGSLVDDTNYLTDQDVINVLTETFEEACG